ncbi:hypothetical protein F9K79_03740 [Ochrobactrum sp. Kaboul]|nr:hypothetical protein F9K79_03740 [Ochrobactrum sp. Kaboul]
MNNESKDQHNQNLQLAHRAFDDNGTFISENNKHMADFAALALKSPALVAAGGIAALLAFYSANWKALNIIAGSVETFNTILSYLFLSLVLSMFAPCLAYLCTWLMGGAAANRKYTYSHPYVHPTISSRICGIASEVVRWITIAVLFSAIILICMAGLEFLKFVKPFTGNA